MDLPEHLKDMDPHSMTVMERVIFYSYEAHQSFENAMTYMNPLLVEQAEQDLYEMLDIIKKVKENTEDQENLTMLERIEKELAADYQNFREG